MIKKIFSFLKKIFIKEKSIEKIEASKETVLEKPNEHFFNSLKCCVITKEKRKVETQICVGDGLGIQNKISY